MVATCERPRHSAWAVILLLLDLLLATAACLNLAFVVPVFVEMFQFSGKNLPRSTQILIAISNALTTFHGVGLGLLLCCVLWMIGRLYVRLHRRGDRKILFARLSAIFIGLVVLMVMMIFTIFRPVFDGYGTIVREPTRESNKVSDATSEPAPSAGSSAHQD